MSKPVNKIEFWRERIKHASREHYSVFEINDTGWNKINRIHERILKEVIPTNAKVLDAGCAYGRSSIFFDNYVGVDFSPDFIEIAKSKYPDKQFIVADLKELPFKDNEFDWSFCISIKKMIEDNLGEEEWDKMLKELKRVSDKVLVLEYGVYESREDTDETIGLYEIL